MQPPHLSFASLLQFAQFSMVAWDVRVSKLKEEDEGFIRVRSAEVLRFMMEIEEGEWC